MKLFKLNHEYYTFISGAIISIAISLMFEAVKNSDLLPLLLCLSSMLLMLFSSVLCFVLSFRVKITQETFVKNLEVQEALRHNDPEAAWNNTILTEEGKINHNGKILLTLFIATVVTCVGSLVLYFLSIIL